MSVRWKRAPRHSCLASTDRVATAAPRAACAAVVMMQSNLNPGQMARARPMSASLRTPRGNPSAPERLRDGQAIPRLAPRPEEAPPGEDEPWLFAFPRCLTTADLWKMGFAQAIMFNAAGWTNEAAAAAEISSATRRAVPLPSLSAEHREDVEGAIAPSFIGGDVVIAVACHGLENLSPDDREECVACMAVRPHPHPRPHPRPHPPRAHGRSWWTASAPCGASTTRSSTRPSAPWWWCWRAAACTWYRQTGEMGRSLWPTP